MCRAERTSTDKCKCVNAWFRGGCAWNTCSTPYIIIFIMYITMQTHSPMICILSWIISVSIWMEFEQWRHITFVRVFCSRWWQEVQVRYTYPDKYVLNKLLAFANEGHAIGRRTRSDATKSKGMFLWTVSLSGRLNDVHPNSVYIN